MVLAFLLAFQPVLLVPDDPPVQQEVVLPWRPLLHRPGKGILIDCWTEETEEGFQIGFRNLGTQEVHFGFYVEGLQDRNAIGDNGRIHLRPGKDSGSALIPLVPGKSMGSIRIVMLRLGKDEGMYLPDCAGWRN